MEQVGWELISTLETSSKEIMEQAGGDCHFLDSTILSFLDEILGLQGYRNSKSPNLRQYHWDFGVVEAPVVNVFARPDGFIHVTDKLLETLSPTPGELASCLVRTS